MNINPYLFFNGNCREAFEFYAKAIGADIKAMVTAGETSGDEAAPESRDQIMHASITIGDDVLMASDWNCGPNPQPYEPPRSFRVSLNVTSATEAERVFHALSERGNIDMPLDKTFFAERFGMLTDRFGIPWMVHCEKDA